MDIRYRKDSLQVLKQSGVSLPTLHVFQLLDVVDCISGVDVVPVAVAEVPQHVFGVEGRVSVVHQLRETQRPDCSEHKAATLESGIKGGAQKKREAEVELMLYRWRHA